jgi:hypothetical protein
VSAALQSATNNFGNSVAVTMTNALNSFTGTFTNSTYYGNGGGLTNLNATNLTGTVPLSNLASTVVTNNATGVTLGGIFTGPLIGNASYATNAGTATTATTAGTATNSPFGPLGTSSVLSSNAFQFSINFLTKNTKYVDAGNGSDANDGSVNYPWATIGYAQVNTPTGWTIAVAPGSYADSATNGQVNWYLCNSASVNFNFIGPMTNNILGQGIVNLSNTGDGVNTQYCTIYCSSLSGSIGLVSYGNYTVYCDNASCSFNGVGGTNSFSLFCKNTLTLGGLSSLPVLNLRANTIILSPGGGQSYSVGSGSSFNAVSVITTTSMPLIFIGQAFIWAVETASIASPSTPKVIFQSGMTFVGNPMFNGSVTAPSFTGAYQTP